MNPRLGLVELARDSTGGAATYARAMRYLLEEVCDDLGFDFIRLVNEGISREISGLDDSVVQYQKWPLEKSRRGFSEIPGLRAFRLNRPREGKDLPSVLVANKIDLVWFLAPNRVISQVTETPFVMTVWDLAHREVQGFPEFTSEGSWQRRESWYSGNIGRAFHVVTDSSHTGKSLEAIYGLYPQNWSSLGLPLPRETQIDVDLADRLAVPYFYYPASFWPHKNHKVLVDALREIADEDLSLVFSGTDEGVEQDLKRYVDRIGLHHRVRFLGRVSDAEVQGLIARSSGVLMPTLLGPTNYPPLEAIRLGVPCIVSPVHHFDGLAPDELRFADPTDPKSWATQMLKLLEAPPPTPSIRFGNEDIRAAIRQLLVSFWESQQIWRFG